MCDTPGCPASGHGPEKVPEESIPAMRMEATSAALHTLDHFGRGWFTTCQALMEDQSRKWGFDAITHMAWTWCLIAAHLPLPDDAPTSWASPETMRRRLTEAADGQEPDEALMATLVRTSDQAQAAFRELVDLARTGNIDAFYPRFDEITDQEDLIRPLLSGMTSHAAVSQAAARNRGNAHALDQCQAAMRQHLPDLDDDEEDASTATLRAMFDLPDAQRP